MLCASSPTGHIAYRELSINVFQRQGRCNHNMAKLNKKDFIFSDKEGEVLVKHPGSING